MGRRPLLAVVVLLVLVLQVAVPLTALVLPDKPHRLGWQMFAGVGEGERVVVIDQHGDELDVPWDELLAKGRRPELDWIQMLPEGLCARLDEPQLTVQIGDDSRTVRC